MNRDEAIKKVAEILWKHEKDLSDGYEHYQGGYEDAVEKVDEIAARIVDAIKGK